MKNTTNHNATTEQKEKLQETPFVEAANLRDYFAAKAMQGMLVNGAFDKFDHIALDAYRMADAMLKAREAS